MLNWLRRRQEKDFVAALTGLSAVGILLMLYLAYQHFKPGGQESVCNFGEALSCDIVNQSPFSDLFGIPLALLGLGFFVAVIVWLRYPQLGSRLGGRFNAVLAASVFGVVFGAGLTAIEIFWLGSICLFCETSKLAMLLMAVIAAYAAGRMKERLRLSWIVAAILLGLAFGGAVTFG